LAINQLEIFLSYDGPIDSVPVSYVWQKMSLYWGLWLWPRYDSKLEIAVNGAVLCDDSCGWNTGDWSRNLSRLLFVLYDCMSSELSRALRTVNNCAYTL